MTAQRMQLIDPPSPFAPMEDLQAFLWEFEAKPHMTPDEEEALQEVRESIAQRQAMNQAKADQGGPA
jgi:hypothetical protein